MKIVIATPFYPPHQGVLGMYAKGLEMAYRKRGDDVHIVSSSDLAHLPPGIRHLFFFSRVLLATKGASFVIALDTWSVGVPALLAARAKHVPCVVRIGGDFLWESYVARTGAQITLTEFYAEGQSLSLKEQWIQKGTQYILRHARVVFTTKFQRELWHRAYDVALDTPIVENYFPPIVGTYLPARGPVFVSAGRAIALKNTALLQKIMTRLSASHPGLELDTRFMQGEAHGQRLAQAYAIAIPSFSEVSSNTAIDAVALGKPFICPKDTGTSERLGECGLFIDTRSESELTQAVESLLDPKVYEKLATAARSFSFTHSWAEIADEISRAAHT